MVVKGVAVVLYSAIVCGPGNGHAILSMIGNSPPPDHKVLSETLFECMRLFHGNAGVQWIEDFSMVFQMTRI